MGVGRSGDADSRTAARNAAEQAQTGADTRLLVAFVSTSHSVEQALAGLAEAAPGVPVVGCTTHGEIGPGGPRDGTVTAAAIGGPGFEVATAVASPVSTRQSEAGYEVAACADAIDLPHKVLMLLTDGLVRDQESIVLGCYRALGAAVPLVGGAAADGWRMRRTFVLADGKAMTDTVVGVAIGSDAPMAVSVSHGWSPVGQPMIITECDGGRIRTLDDQPALDVYLGRLGAPPEAYTDPAAFSTIALSHPLGIQRRSGVDVHNPATDVDLVDKSIGGSGTISPGGLIWIMTGTEQSVIDATKDACQDAWAQLRNKEPIGVLAFSCAALREVLGEGGIGRDDEQLRAWTGSLPYAGCFTYGEIARRRGVGGFHNQTIALLALT